MMLFFSELFQFRHTGRFCAWTDYFIVVFESFTGGLARMFEPKYMLVCLGSAA